MSETLPGLHHVTAITGDAQRNIDFYTGPLGLRLVKLTVNFDDPGAYHLYYGDAHGNPGTIMTFFAWPGQPAGRGGAGQTTATAFAIPRVSLAFWRDHLTAAGITFTEPAPRFGESVLSFSDPDGLTIELVATDDPRPAWDGPGPIPAEHRIRGFHGVTLTLRARTGLDDLLRGPLGFVAKGEQPEAELAEPRVRYVSGKGEPGGIVDILTRPDVPFGQDAVGTVHHIAWRTPDDATQLAWRGTLSDHGQQVTPVQDRQYFHSIYFRTPGRVLFEIATDAPGFATDETPDTLGTSLKLPPQYEPYRTQLERALPPVRLPARQ